MMQYRITAWRALVILLVVGITLPVWGQAPAKGPASAPAKKVSKAVLDFTRLINRHWKGLPPSIFEDRKDAPKPPSRSEVLAALRKLGDDDLAALFALKAKEGPSVLESSSLWLAHELCLGEMVRRGGERWEKLIRRRIKAEGREIELLNTLRRLQKRNDAVMVLLDGTADDWECNLGFLPRFPVRLTNLDSDRKAVGFQSGGDYRSGRQARWRLEVKDEAGKILPQKGPPGLMGGGLTGWGKLRFAESWSTVLTMADYVDVHVPGKYTIRVLYHDAWTIANMSAEAVEGLAVCASIPLTLTVKAMVVEISDAERKNIPELIAKLPAKGPVKICGGVYEKTVHDFIPPDSPAGQLLAMEWKPALELIKAALSDKTPPGRRAWILGLLYSISGWNDPMRAPGVLGPYDYRHSGWSLFGGGASGIAGGGFGRGAMSIKVGTIDEKKQIEFAKKWKVWLDRDYIKVVKPAGRKEDQDSGRAGD